MMCSELQVKPPAPKAPAAAPSPFHAEAARAMSEKPAASTPEFHESGWSNAMRPAGLQTMMTVIRAAAKFHSLVARTPREPKQFFTATYHTADYGDGVLDGDNPMAVAVSHASGIPASWVGRRDPELAPSAEMLKKYHGRDDETGHAAYALEYLELLGSRGLNASAIAEKYPNGTIFVCYDYDEGDTSICHRLILSELLNATGVADVAEMVVAPVVAPAGTPASPLPPAHTPAVHRAPIRGRRG